MYIDTILNKTKKRKVYGHGIKTLNIMVVGVDPHVYAYILQKGVFRISHYYIKGGGAPGFKICTYIAQSTVTTVRVSHATGRSAVEFSREVQKLLWVRPPPINIIRIITSP